MNIITSSQNEQIKHLAKLLQSTKYRREQRATVLEGAHLLDSYLQAGWMPQKVFIPQHRGEHDDIRVLIVRLPENHIVWVSQGALSKISDLSHADDIMSLITLPLSGSLNKVRDAVILDAVQDTGNLGTILRSAAAAGVRDVVLGKGCADAWSPKVLRSGMGAHFLLNLHERVDLATYLPQYDGQILATALSSLKHFSLYDNNLDLIPPTAWLFGNEGQGVSPDYLALAHATVKIPMLGATESLNVAMAATVCLFEQMRQRLHFQAA